MAEVFILIGSASIEKTTRTADSSAGGRDLDKLEATASLPKV